MLMVLITAVIVNMTIILSESCQSTFPAEMCWEWDFFLIFFSQIVILFCCCLSFSFYCA